MDESKYPSAHEIVADYLRQLDSGVVIKEEDIIANHPALEAELRIEFRNLDLIAEVVDGASNASETNESSRNAVDESNATLVSNATVTEETVPTILRCPHCRKPTNAELEESIRAVQCESCGEKFSLIRDRKWPDKIGHFELVEPIGRGGFGTVWKARDQELDRFVALKLPRRVFLEESEAEQFYREARTAANLSHQNIVKVHEVGLHDESIYIACELIVGKPLSEYAKQGLGEKDIVELSETLARALHYAHEQGVIHRDLKPQNVMMDSSGKPYLSDFGLARRDNSDNEVTITVAGQILGTPAYMSPEQARGESHTADARSDIYSFGTMLYELLAGEVPFQGNQHYIMAQIRDAEPTNPRRINGKISLDLATICMKCLEKSPERRYQTALDVADELRRVATGKPIDARPVSIVNRTYRWAQRNPTIASLAACLLVAFCAMSVLGAFYYAEREIGVNQSRESLLTKIRQIRTEAKSGYRDEIRTLIISNAALVEDDRLKDEFREEWLLCLGDFTAFQARELNFQGRSVTSAAISADGTWVAIGCLEIKDDQRKHWVEVRDVNRLQADVKRAVLDDEVIAISFCADPNQLAVLDANGSLSRISNDGVGPVVTSQHLLWPYQHTANLNGCFTPDATHLVVADNEQVQLWDLGDGETKFENAARIPEGSRTRCLAISRDARQIGLGYSSDLGSISGVIRWDLSEPEATRRDQKEVNKGALYGDSIAFSDDGTWLALGGARTLILESSTLEQRQFYYASTANALAFCANSNYLAIGYEGYTEIRNHKSNALVGSVPLSNNWYGLGADFSQHGQTLLCWNRDCLRILDLDQHTERNTIDFHEGGIPSLTFMSDEGTTLVSTSSDGSVRFWDVTNGKSPKQTGQSIHVPGQVQCVALHGEWMAVADWRETAGDDRDTISIWHIGRDASLEKPLLAIPNDLGEICGLGFSPNGDYLAASGSHGLRVWSLERGDDGKINHTLFWSTGPDKGFGDDKFLSFDPRGGRLFHAANWGYRVMCLDLGSRGPIHSDLGSPDDKRDMLLGWHGLVFTGDNRIAFVNPEGGLDIWDVDDMPSGELIRSTPPGVFADSHIAISSSGLLAGKSTPNTVLIWDIKANKELYSFRPESSNIYSFAWNDTGTRLAVGLSDGSISIWDLEAVDKQLKLLGFATR